MYLFLNKIIQCCTTYQQGHQWWGGQRNVCITAFAFSVTSPCTWNCKCFFGEEYDNNSVDISGPGLERRTVGPLVRVTSFGISGALVLQKFQMKFEVYATKHYDQQCQRQRSSLVTRVEQHAKNSLKTYCRGCWFQSWCFPPQSRDMGFS